MKIGFASVFLFLVGAVSAECTDSDGGKDIYENGEIHFRGPYAQDYDNGMYTYDSCFEGKLNEYFCSENGTNIEMQVFECPDGYNCAIDKCIKNDEEYVGDIKGNGESPSVRGSEGGNGDSCTKYYDCEDGTQVKYCSRVKEETPITCVNSTVPGAGPLCKAGSVKYSCECEENPKSLCTSDCKNLYWIDNENKSCGQQKFCGEYMYYSLQTFESKEGCLRAVANETEEKNETNNFNLSNGRKAEIKIMPETASEKAIERLGELNFTVELKEVGKGNETRAVYEIKSEKEGRLFGLFKIRANVSIEVDAEGNVKEFSEPRIKRPWWAFLATGI